MRCNDCGKQFDNLYEYANGRRLIRICAMCRAERQWRESPESAIIPSLLSRKPSLWERIKKFFRRK